MQIIKGIAIAAVLIIAGLLALIVATYLALPQDWRYGVLELGRQICRAEMPAKRRLRVLENVRNVQRSNGTV